MESNDEDIVEKKWILRRNENRIPHSVPRRICGHDRGNTDPY